MFIDLIRHFHIDADIAPHLAQNYGDRAWDILQQQESSQSPLSRLSSRYPVTTAEIRYAVTHEYAVTTADVLARRMRLACLDAKTALQALPTVIDAMGEELDWSEERKRSEWKDTTRFLASMGPPAELAGVSRVEVVKMGVKWPAVRSLVQSTAQVVDVKEEGHEGAGVLSPLDAAAN